MKDRQRVDVESVLRKSKIKEFVSRIQELPQTKTTKMTLPMNAKSLPTSKRTSGKPNAQPRHSHRNGIAIPSDSFLKFEDSDDDFDMISLVGGLHELDIDSLSAPVNRSGSSQISKSPPAYYPRKSSDSFTLKLDIQGRSDVGKNDKRRNSVSRPSSARSIDSTRSPITVNSISNASKVYSSPKRTNSARSTSAIRSQPKKQVASKTPVDFNVRAQQRKDRITQLQKAAQDRHQKQHLLDEEDARYVASFYEQAPSPFLLLPSQEERRA